jgi:hypothetical protein
MAVYRIFGLTFFSSIIVATNRTVSPSHRGTMNGLAGLGWVEVWPRASDLPLRGSW